MFMQINFCHLIKTGEIVEIYTLILINEKHLINTNDALRLCL